MGPGEAQGVITIDTRSEGPTRPREESFCFEWLSPVPKPNMADITRSEWGKYSACNPAMANNTAHLDHIPLVYRRLEKLFRHIIVNSL